MMRSCSLVLSLVVSLTAMAQDEVVDVIDEEQEVVVEGVAIAAVEVEAEADVDAEAEEGAAEEVDVQEIEFADMALAVPAGPQQRQLAKLQTYAKVECAFVRRLFKLTEEQEKTLSEIDDKWIAKASAKKNEKKVGVRMQQPGLIAQFFGAKPRAVQVVNRANRNVNVSLVKERISDHISGLLTDEQTKEYQVARDKRNEAHAAGVADALIESLHTRLALTDKQRADIKKKLIPWVKTKEGIRVDMFFNGNDYYPEIPVGHLTALTAEQKEIYNGLQRYMWTDENFHDGQEKIVIKR